MKLTKSFAFVSKRKRGIWHKKGFTLVEVLLYVAIFAVVAGILSAVLITVIRTQSRDAASNEVATQLDFVLTTVQRLVRDASLIDIVYEGTSTSTACSTYCTMRLRMEDSTREPTIIRSDASGIYLKEGASDEVVLTTDKITVNNFTITKFEIAGGHASAQIDASFTFNTNNPQLVVTKTLQSAISRVSAATFDSDLIPNADQSWSLGQITPNARWQNGYFSGELTVGASAVEGSAILSLDSTTRGFLPPRMTTGQRGGIQSPAAGLIIYNTDTNTFEGYDGTSWGELGGGLWTLAGTDIYRLDGNIGIGLTNPGSELEIRGDDGIAEIRLTETSGASWADWAIRAEQVNDDGIGFYNHRRDIYKLWIEESGGVGIGTRSPAVELEVQSSNANYTAIRIQNNESTPGVWELRSSQETPNNGFVIWGGGEGSEQTRLVIEETGDVGIGLTNPTYRLQLSVDSAGKPNGGSWANSSDERIKTNINPIIGALEKIINLQGVSFEWKNPEEHSAGTDEVRAGFIAQDVEKIFPQFISEIDASGKDKLLTADGKVKSLTLPFDFDAYLVEAIKELNAKVDSLAGTVENAVVKVKKLVADSIKARVVQVEYMEYVDRATGEIYCTWIENGDFVKEKGSCE